MPVTVVVAFRAKPGRAEELVRWLRDNQPKLPRFEGFLSIVLARDEQDADRIVEIERWASAAHHRAMVERVAAAGGWDELDALTEGEPEVSYLAELASLRVEA
ncbi:MAG TPA: antibiotic biosynthesis monooxygenase family protein [Sandaracinaceae bacterium]